MFSLSMSSDFFRCIVNASGRSILEMWPAPAISTNCDPSRSLCISRIASCGRSFSPTKKRTGREPRDRGAEVMVAKRSTTADKSIKWRREHHPAHFNNARRIGSIDIRRKPALQRRLGDRRYSATLGHDDPLFPLFSAGRSGCAGESQTITRSMRSAYCSASPSAVAPPGDNPQNAHGKFERVHQGDGVG